MNDDDFNIESFKQWLRSNRTILEGRMPDEIASLAHLCGFTWEVILPVLSHFHDAMSGSSFDNRANMHIAHESITIEMLSGKVNLREKWKEVSRKQNLGLDFDE